MCLRVIALFTSVHSVTRLHYTLRHMLVLLPSKLRKKFLVSECFLVDVGVGVGTITFRAASRVFLSPRLSVEAAGGEGGRRRDLLVGFVWRWLVFVEREDGQGTWWNPGSRQQPFGFSSIQHRLRAL